MQEKISPFFFFDQLLEKTNVDDHSRCLQVVHQSNDKHLVAQDGDVQSFWKYGLKGMNHKHKYMGVPYAGNASAM